MLKVGIHFRLVNWKHAKMEGYKIGPPRFYNLKKFKGYEEKFSIQMYDFIFWKFLPNFLNKTPEIKELRIRIVNLFLNILSWKFHHLYLKVASATFLLVFSLNFFQTRSLVKLEKILFISLQKLFLFSRKSNFSILDLQISWPHQMSKHKTSNTFYWIT